MKIRSSIIWFIVIVTALIALLLWYGKTKKTISATNSIETNIIPATTTTLPVPITKILQTNLVPNNVPPSVRNKGEQIKEGLSQMNDIPIVFFGRLEDQFGSPVATAQITANIRIYNGIESTVEHLEATSDGNGMFQIQGGKGESLGIMPSKQGYVTSATNTYFKYSYMYPDHFSPDPNNPTIIKMWKLQGAEPLVDIGAEYKIPFNGMPILFDLVTGKVVATGGDLEAVITKISGSLSKKSPGNWSIDLKPINGGIAESDYQVAQITYEAPADGYQEDYFVQMNDNDPAWRDGIDQEFFLKSRNGQVYSKFYLVFGINRSPNDPLYFQFKGVANTNGSRNWEETAPK